MRNKGSRTPSSKQDQKDEAAGEKTSGKKLVQARLPFKILASGVSSPATVVAVSDAEPVSERIGTGDLTEDLTSKQDVRKRKLSYDEEDKTPELLATESKENVSFAASKKKRTSSIMEDEVVVLNDSETEDEAEAPLNTNDKTSLVPSIINATLPNTPVQCSTKRKGAGTPKSISASGSVGRKESPRGSATKLQIKLPLSSKKKHRKSQRQSIMGNVESTPEAKAYSSDEIEIISQEHNPLKRPKVDDIVKATDAEEKYQGKNGDNHNTIRKIVESPSRKSTRITSAASEEKGSYKKITPKENTETTEENEKLETETITLDDVLEDLDSSKVSSCASETQSKKKCVKTLDGFISKGGSCTKRKTVTPEKKLATNSKSINKKASVDVPDEAVDDEHVDNSSVSSENEVICLDIDEKSVENERPKITDIAASAASSQLHNSASAEQPKAVLTPKQQKLMEQRRIARENRDRRLQEQKEERERKLQEEKLQKQREREEKELSKKREREEKEELKRKEREEKEEVKRKDREEKERKRLAEIDAKNEERRKRNEVKEEEMRKREEERKRKEQEKEEAENKKKKAAEAFTKFFVPKSTNPSTVSEIAQLTLVKNGAEDDKSGPESLAFRPFQIKGDMQLAPLVRKVFTEAAREKLDSFLTTAANSQALNKPSYLSELRTGEIKPGKWRRPTVDTKEEDNDVVIVEDELERAAQTIVEESGRTVERYRAKLYKFHENKFFKIFKMFIPKFHKNSSIINFLQARKNWISGLLVTEKHFDYEVDSDSEWEEEEPGESLDGSDEEKEKESEDEDYEVDNEWFVPHGHLSDEEMQNEDECGLGDDNTREAQKAKLKILQQEFAQEMKKKTEKIKPRLVGCIWQDFNGNQPELCPNIIWNSLNMRAMLFTTSPIVEEPSVESNSEPNESNSPTIATSVAGVTEKLKRILLTEDMLKDLIRLVHGNRHSKVFLINEFIAHIEKSEDAIKNGDVRGPLKSVVRDKIDELALWQVTEPNNKNKMKKNKKKLCWLVSEEKLKQYDLQSLELHNNWSYTLPPKFVERATQNDDELAEGSGNAASHKGTSKSPSSNKKVKNKTITKFTKVLTTEEKAVNPQQMADDAKIGAIVKTPTSSKKLKSFEDSKSSNKIVPNSEQSAVPIIKKRVPLLMSVARGQQISTPAKNALISQFLKKSKDDTEKNEPTVSATAPMNADEVVVLD